MNCSSGSCSTLFPKSLTGIVSLDNDPFECVLISTGQQAGLFRRFVDVIDCLQGNIKYSNGNLNLAYSPACCIYPELYDPTVTSNGLYCVNPNFTFSTDTCHLYNTGNFNNPEIACPTAGIIDALTSSLASIALQNTYGFGLDAHTANYRVPGCFDATGIQQRALNKITHQFCPLLGPQFSYSSDFSFMYQDNLDSFTANGDFISECCLRADQSNPELPLGNQCHMMLCQHSPICSYFFRKRCKSANYSNPDCIEWLSYSANNIYTTRGEDTTIPAIGTEPSSVDQAMFSVLDYCGLNDQDHATCDSILENGGGLLFPRLDTLHVGDFINQLVYPNPQYQPIETFGTGTRFYSQYLLNTATYQTVQFTVTNMSRILISSLTVRIPDSAYTVTIQDQTLLPFATTNVTLSTTLTEAQGSFTYVKTYSKKVYTDAYNTSGCNMTGKYLGSWTWHHYQQSFSTASDIDEPEYRYLKCDDDDIEIGYFSTTTPYENYYDGGPGTDDFNFPFGGKCETEAFDHAMNKNSTFPGCRQRCILVSNGNPGGECIGQYDENCDKREGTFTTLTLGTSCSSKKYQNLPFYFYDAMKTDLTNPRDNSYVILGGFVGSLEKNIMDLSFRSYHLIVLPLTTNKLAD